MKVTNQDFARLWPFLETPRQSFTRHTRQNGEGTLHAAHVSVHDTRLTRMPFERTLSTMVSTSIPGLRERRSNAVPFATADATRDESADRVTVLAAAFTVCRSASKPEWRVRKERV